MSEEPPSFSISRAPEPLVDALLEEVFRTCPHTRICFLAECGSLIHAAAARVLFKDIKMEDDARVTSGALTPAAIGPISAIAQNPARYSPHVKRLTVVDPSVHETAGESTNDSILFDDDLCSEDAHSATIDVAVPLMSAAGLEVVLRDMRSLESFSWKATALPPDGICETLSTYNLRLTEFTYAPQTSISPRHSSSMSVKWDAPSLPLLSTLKLSRLRLSRLTQIGARAFSHFLSLLEEDYSLDTMAIDISWLDEELCALIGNACRRATTIHIGSEGTRLNDNGVLSILESCHCLKEFLLIDAHGRLSKGLWAKPDPIPPQLESFKVAISEHTVHHSWAIDHLSGLHALPLAQLSHLSIIRIVHPFREIINEHAAIKRIPEEFVDAFRNASNLITLECDWWLWQAEQIKIPLQHCPRLRAFKFAFDGPLSKLLSMTSPFSSAKKLEKIAIWISLEHAPALPPSPAITASTSGNGFSPSASPILLHKSLSTSVIDGSFTDEPAKQSSTLDASLPHLRDIRKFARKCIKLEELFWYGKNGRGKWIISRSVGSDCKSTSTGKANHLPVIDHVPHWAIPEQYIDTSVWESSRWDQGFGRIYVNPSAAREGAEWTGSNAEVYLAARAADKEREELALKEEKALRAATSNSRKSSLNLNGAGNGPSVPSSGKGESEASESLWKGPPSPISPIFPVKVSRGGSSTAPKSSYRRASGPSIAREPNEKTNIPGFTTEDIRRARSQSYSGSEVGISHFPSVYFDKGTISGGNGHSTRTNKRGNLAKVKSVVPGHGRVVPARPPRTVPGRRASSGSSNSASTTEASPASGESVSPDEPIIALPKTLSAPRMPALGRGQVRKAAL